jgi:protein-S-isoprenylcysteine O-methyltransferase Ste14
MTGLGGDTAFQHTGAQARAGLYCLATMIRVILRLTADALILAIVLFTAAGTLAWPHAWVLLAVVLVVRILSAIVVFRENPELLRERATTLMHHGQPFADKVVLLALMATAFIGVPAIAAWDVFHWHVLPRPQNWISSFGLAVFIVGWMIAALALRENAFAVTVVRTQQERNHTLVDTGVYSVVRHPMYSGNPMILAGMSLWLGSYTAVLFAVVPLALLVVRIRLEEEFLSHELPGYVEYMKRVPYRLVPGIW